MFLRSSYNAMFTHRQMNIHSSKMLTALQRLSSGYRINSAKDDPAGLAISERMRAQITAMRQGIRNAQMGQDMVDTADGALAGVHSVLNRMVDLTTQAASATLNETQRSALQQELNQLREELVRTTAATNFSGSDLLQGNSQNGEPTKIQIGPTAERYDQLAINLPNMNSVLKMLDGLDVMTPEAAGAALETVNAAIDQVSTMRGNLGATGSRMEYFINAQEVALENLEEAESRIRDADMAKEMMNYVKASVGCKVAQVMMAHAMQEPYRVLELVKDGAASAPSSK
ncbi:flagellin [Ruminococcaceae bacterium OttesenSCG-928-D13]|nr:flagellin [Ruminococcaceae bacterium OttesenSCG-928-D13]